MKIFGLWTERSDFLRKTLLRVAKGAFHVSRATLWEKDDRSKFSVCGFFKSLRDFFFTDKKLAVGVKTTT